MKMMMIAYNEAIETEVLEVLEKCGLENYTKMNNVFGKGNTSGTHLGNDIWPGKNSILFVACEDSQAKQTLRCVRELRTSLGKEGIKAFVMPLEEIT